MYVEAKDGELEGHRAWIGWVSFSKTRRTVYYKGRKLMAIGGRGVRGNFLDQESGQEYWVSGVKARGSNAHSKERGVVPVIDEDAKAEYALVKSSA